METARLDDVDMKMDGWAMSRGFRWFCRNNTQQQQE